MADSGAEYFDRPEQAPPVPFWVDRDWSEGPMATMGLDPNDPKVQQKLQAADQSKFYKPGMNLRRYDEEIKPLLKGNPYTQRLRGSQSRKKDMMGGDSSYAQFNIGRQLAGFQDVAPQWLTDAGQRAAGGFKNSVPVDKMNKIAQQMAKAHNMKKNMQIASVLASIASAGVGAYVAPATLAGQAALGAGMGAANAGTQAAISGNWDPTNIALGAVTGALPAAGGAMTGAGVNPLISGAATGMAGSALKGAVQGNINPMDVVTGGVTGAVGPATKMAGLPNWISPFVKAGVDYGFGQATGKTSKKPMGPQGAVQNLAQMPGFVNAPNPYA